jgi:hypothetical protein
MNWQTKEILEKAVKTIADEGVFTLDQITLLSKMLSCIAAAIEKEADMNKPSVTL